MNASPTQTRSATQASPRPFEAGVRTPDAQRPRATSRSGGLGLVRAALRRLERFGAPLSLSWAALAIAATLAGVGALQVAEPTAFAALFSAHLTHLSVTQLVMAGGVTLCLLVALERRYGGKHLAAGGVWIGLAVAVCVLLLEADRIASYAGSSGLGHGLAAWWLLGLGASAGEAEASSAGERSLEPWRVAGLALLSLKVMGELSTGSVAGAIGLGPSGVPVPVAHAAGVAAGALLGVGERLRALTRSELA